MDESTLPKVFTRDWITAKTDPWLEYVVPRLSSKPSARWIEIGSYQGASAWWTLHNVLRGPGSLIYCIDTFDPLPPARDGWGDPDTNYVEIFDANVGCLPGVVKLQGRSWDVLAILRGTQFDGAYVDGEHAAEPVRRDVALLWPLLKSGAVCVFDDYGWNDDPGVKTVVDELLADPRSGAKLLHAGFQAVVLKTTS